MQRDLFRGRLVRLAAPRQEDTAALARWSHDAGYLRAVVDTVIQNVKRLELRDKPADSRQ